MAALVFENDHLQVFHRSGSSDYLLCTFNEIGMVADGADYWARGLADKLDLHCLGFVTKWPNWFPARALSDAVAAVRHLANPFSRRYGYGHSQGGYAAIKASRPLELTSAIVFCPQFSIDPADIIDPRFNGYFDPVLNGGMAIQSGDAPANLLMFYDHADALDRSHVEHIANVVPARLVKVPSTGHGTVRVLAGSAMFTDIVRAVESDVPLGRIMHDARRRHPLRHSNLALRASSRHPAWAANILKMGNAPATDFPAICFALYKAGAAQSALPWALLAADQMPADAEAQAVCALVSAELGLHDQAQLRAQRAVELKDDTKFAWVKKHVLDLAAQASGGSGQDSLLVRRVKKLEKENARLRRAVFEMTLEKLSSGQLSEIISAVQMTGSKLTVGSMPAGIA